jgi:hypothetical protein
MEAIHLLGLKQQHPIGALLHEQGKVGEDISAQERGNRWDLPRWRYEDGENQRKGGAVKG